MRFRRVKSNCWEKGHAKNTNALLAVMELHKPFMYEGRFGQYARCSGCSSKEEWLGNIYPCPTVQVVEKELAR